MKLPLTANLIEVLSKFSKKDIPQVLEWIKTADFQRGRILFRFILNFPDVSSIICGEFPPCNSSHAHWLLEICRVMKITCSRSCIEKLVDTDKFNISFFAYRALGELSTDSRFLLRKLHQEKDWMIKKEILRAMKGIHTTESGEYLLSMIESSNSLLKTAIRDSLEENTRFLCSQYVNFIEKGSFQEKLIGLELLGLNGNKTHLKFIQNLLEKQPEQRIELRGIRAIGRLGDVSEEEFLGKYLKSDEWIIRREAAEALGKWKNNVSPMIMEKIQSDNNYLVREAFISSDTFC